MTETYKQLDLLKKNWDEETSQRAYVIMQVSSYPNEYRDEAIDIFPPSETIASRALEILKSDPEYKNAVLYIQEWNRDISSM